MATELSDHELVCAIALGNQRAFAEFYDRQVARVYGFLLRMLPQEKDAEDVLQETFLKAYTHLGRFQGNSRFYTWVVRIAVNESLMKLRKRRSDRQVSLDEKLETDDDGLLPREIVDWGDNPEKRYAKTEWQEILAEATQTLEPAFRTVFTLRDVEQLSTEETAEALGLSVPAVKSRLLRARLKLRQRLKKYFK